MTNTSKKKVIVVGGGFAGIQFIKALNEKLFDVLLIDKINHHQFQPLFYQVATSQLEPSSISFPLRNIFKKKPNVQIRLATVLSIDKTQNKIATSIGDFDYDYLVIAIGCTTNFFGNEIIKENSLTLKSTYDAITIRNHILQTFETIISANEDEKESLFNFVIVGAGPTGVEMAGAFAEIKEDVLPKDYQGIDFSRLNIYLIEGTKNTLNSMSPMAQIASKNYLQKMGVTIYTETFVKNYDENVLTLSTGESIKTKTVIWAAGVTGNHIEGFTPEIITPTNRLKVNRINKVFESENIFALGDIAYMETPLYPKAHPQLANVAINQAKLLAKNLKYLEQNKPTRNFEYKDLGSMATIGRNKAVVDLPFFHFSGYFAWLTWIFVHLMLILSVKNKLIIFINWAWAYISKDTSLALILSQHNKTKVGN
ncbi:NADH dehydrogenase [Flavobacterium sp. CG_9.10]|uniref:NAD(P)/FAD-dependent oxidoreductase n=1 Tax=Flavobacterium sp. CG_9.10 TaxID=2787729 RepID=UPI0018C96FBE|nr:NAD(P)/FAD-dependent oxidoreductase [Flavobacterium sp. CG_9.10]MBG6111927.1 NADH dehydrogenase [Flavobacterium sp. CG_9.10]